ncbi:DinB family protein [Prosthecochloris sp. SCSIO W1103]|uniref:DinB family protein n=1 Tax=Prosthecochloris sp. SCSIO W1103 TaxID=2992244 RepID=UPI00223DD871|nr:DUF1572 family protein [Prosthecochloris sp. SCSIO W1103]UZJ38241.1 DinB family protein [Prosthecochloris sp. SCSIO W1103]
MPNLFTAAISQHLEIIAKRLVTCLHAVGATELWNDFAPNLSSPGNLVLHVTGNLNQYVLKTLGNKKIYRERDKEFCDKPGTNLETLTEMLETTISECISVVNSLDNERLSQTYRVQGLQYSGYGILIHATEHLSHHTGQFIWFCKYLFNADIDLFKGRDLNVQ